MPNLPLGSVTGAKLLDILSKVVALPEISAVLSGIVEMNRSITLEIFLCLLCVQVGCGDSSDSDASSIGRSLGENVTEFAQGVGTGVDEKLHINVELSESLIDVGLAVTVAKQETPTEGGGKSISVYLVAESELSATLMAKAYNKEALEIGRCTADIAFDKDDAQYVRFVFPAEMDQQTVDAYRIELKREDGRADSNTTNESINAESASES